MFVDGGAVDSSTTVTGLHAGQANALEPMHANADASSADSSDSADSADSVDSVSGDNTLHECVDIAPLGGRLLAFWSDTMVHGVLPSQAHDEREYRWALTVWLHTDDLGTIAFDADAEQRHFGGTDHRGLAG